MPHSFAMEFADPASEHPVELSGSVSDEDWTAFEAFLLAAQDLTEEPELQGLCVSLHVGWDGPAGPLDTCSLPSDKKLALLLRRLRPFVDKAPLSGFHHVRARLSQYLDHPVMEIALTRLERLYDGVDLKAYLFGQGVEFGLIIDEVLIRQLEVFESDPDADWSTQEEAPPQMAPLRTPDSLFVILMVERMKAVYQIAGLIHAMSDEDNSFTLQV